MNLNPTIAVKVHERLSLGVGFDIQHSSATLANRLDFGSFGAAMGCR